MEDEAIFPNRAPLRDLSSIDWQQATRYSKFF